MTNLAETLFSTPEMTSIFSDAEHVRAMLAFEAALAEAEAEVGVIPRTAATAIAEVARLDNFDVLKLLQESIAAGTLAIPLVRRLTDSIEGQSKNFVHWGATSQDVIDTASVLQMRAGFDVLDRQLMQVAACCAELAERHRSTPMPGRTLLQQALPITFGLKAARWLGFVTRQVQALRELRPRVLVVQFGGAAGTLASLGQYGWPVAERLADRLGLGVPELPWHTERDRPAAVASQLGILAGGMAKMATDVLLMAQSEVGEVAPGSGGSSAMPHKRNPVHAVAAISAARLAIGLVPVVLSAMVQEHERAAGAWQSEWSSIPDIFRFTVGSLDRVGRVLNELELDPQRMQANLELSQGLIMAEAVSMALAQRLGRPAAYQLVQTAISRARTTGVSFRQALLEADVSADVVDPALDPTNYLGCTNLFIDRALAEYLGLKTD